MCWRKFLLTPLFLTCFCKNVPKREQINFKAAQAGASVGLKQERNSFLIETASLYYNRSDFTSEY